MTTLAWLGVMLYLMVVPHLPPVPLMRAGTLNPLGHYGTNVVLGALLYLLAGAASPALRPRGRAALLSLGLATVVGLGSEGLQLFVPTRSPEPLDLALDVAGAATGVGLVVLLELRVERAPLSVAAVAVAVLLTGVVATTAAFWSPRYPRVVDCGPTGAPVQAAPLRPPQAAQAGAARHPPTSPAARVTDGLVALYGFGEGAGTVVRDVSGAGAPLDLEVSDPAKVRWVPGSSGVQFVSPGAVVRSRGAAAKLYDALTATNELTVEVWVTPASLSQEGPVRLVTMSGGTWKQQVNFHVGQEYRAVSFRVRTICSYFNETLGRRAFADTETPRHVVATYDGAVKRVYVDGVAREDAEALEGDFSNWDPGYPLAIGNEVSLNRSFLGTVHLVAIYDRALTDAEIVSNFNAGPSAGRSAAR